MLALRAGEVPPVSAFLLFGRGLMEGVGDGVSRGGLLGFRDPGHGDALLPWGLGDLRSALLSRSGSVGEGLSESLPAAEELHRSVK